MPDWTIDSTQTIVPPCSSLVFCIVFLSGVLLVADLGADETHQFLLVQLGNVFPINWSDVGISFQPQSTLNHYIFRAALFTSVGCTFNMLLVSDDIRGPYVLKRPLTAVEPTWVISKTLKCAIVYVWNFPISVLYSVEAAPVWTDLLQLPLLNSEPVVYERKWFSQQD